VTVTVTVRSDKYQNMSHWNWYSIPKPSRFGFQEGSFTVCPAPKRTATGWIKLPEKSSARVIAIDSKANTLADTRRRFLTDP
jgi:hypothetical protein